MEKMSCDLLENIYLCGINNNKKPEPPKPKLSCDLLENIYLCGTNNNSSKRWYCRNAVVICLKISTFVVPTTTK